MAEPPGPSRPRRRWQRCCCSCLLVVILVPAVIYIVARQTSARRFSEEVAQLKQSGEPLKVGELLPKVHGDGDNAAAVYQRAFDLQPGGRPNSTGGAAQWTSAEAISARKLVADNGEYFAALDKASRRPVCVFDKDWGAVPNVDLPEFAQLRDAVRDLVVKAEVERTAGRIDDAAASCLTTLRVANHAQQTPIAMSYVVSTAMQQDALEELERVLSSGDPSPSACRALYYQLGRRQDLAPYVSALRGERACQLAIFRTAEKRGAIRGHWPGTDRANPPFDLYPVLGKPWWNQDKRNVIRSMQWLIEAGDKPWPQAVKKMRDGQQAVERLPFFSSILTRLAFPVFTLGVQRARHHVAEAGAAQIAVAATAFRRARGHYPASLQELARDGWRLPRDPFTDQPYHYARDGRGIAVWSIGPDLADNNGADWDSQLQREDQPGTDFAFHCRR